MNAPRIAKFIRRCGLAICKLAKPFVPEDEAKKQVERLFASSGWQEKLETKTDREIGRIVAYSFGDYEIGTKEEAVIAEAIDRLARSPLGPNRLDDHGNRIHGIALSIRLIPNKQCDQCAAIGYVCQKSYLCLDCLGLLVLVEDRRQKLSATLRGRSAGLMAEIRDKLRSFQTQK